ncbi:U1 small nuclear ribonucleoprotein C [Impatiens glandulifera]|uniref:U1 small nuclear ribonucleoprotein C n=1 Tax=Impatiens glandulifera TaxID=253017 RepID=UPI001FB0A578|nr:U1 small nuclear ribonucleoprotein C [Impatiens glandulifera]
MPRYYCDYCDTYLTHDSPSVRKQHNAGYKHKANVRTYYQQFESQLHQIMVDQKIKEHLGQAAAFRPVGAPFNPLRPQLPLLPTPGMTMMGGGPMNMGPPLIPGMRPPMLPPPYPGAPGGYMSGPPGMMPQMAPPPMAPLPGQQQQQQQQQQPPMVLPRPPPLSAHPAFPGGMMLPNSTGIAPSSAATPSIYQGGVDNLNLNAAPSDSDYPPPFAIFSPFKHPLMAATPISIWPATFLALSMSVMVMTVASSKLHDLPIKPSSIAASPAAGFFPHPPLSSPPPAFSPDTLPLFPSPGAATPSPTESSIPTIPSSQSPPNPDVIGASGPDSAMSPAGTLLPSSSAFDPDSSSPAVRSSSLAMAVTGTVALWVIMQLN